MGELFSSKFNISRQSSIRVCIELCKLLLLLLNIRQGWKCYPRTDTLAYFGSTSMPTKKKSFLTLAAANSCVRSFSVFLAGLLLAGNRLKLLTQIDFWRKEFEVDKSIGTKIFFLVDFLTKWIEKKNISCFWRNFLSEVNELEKREKALGLFVNISFPELVNTANKFNLDSTEDCCVQVQS